ncbi:bile acid:sodium symporter family protein [Oceanobacillus alkalisoli]|uniref:bile acid:sodium symporter family protein n=1 Tax=Oceanobacillus alkalisoli TaxID=2925113 RepID=UPI001F11DDCC|nr:bile acid:sodium symporter family protein [Oceanobacillus alkalisoli]MCF3943128.1 bile acid:sodium symporter family protein [Oceanobacillus alkalisoli]
MEVINRISNIAGKYFALIIIIFSVIAFMVPEWFSSFGAYIPILLGVVMFGMGLTLKASDFKLVFTKPIPVLIGVVAQFSIMPTVAFVIAYLLQLPAEIAAGLVLLGSVPGGTASNVMVFLAKGNLPLSITMTSVSTLLAPIMTPLLLLIFAGQWLPVNPMSMFMSIVQVIVIPIILGLLVNKYFPKTTEKGASILPLISIVAITIIVSSIVANNKENIASAGILVFVSVLLHNGFGLLLGFYAGKLCRLPVQDQRAISIEVGMQNSGLGVALASVYFTPLAALPSAFASAWQLITGTMLASKWGKSGVPNERDTSVEEQPNDAALEEKKLSN